MSLPSQPPQRRLGVYGFTLLVVLAVFWMMDGITVYDAPAPAGRPPAIRHDRVFILLLDSLRYETAIDPDFMPTLAGLRERGTWAKVQASFNAVTTPSLRAAFTGRDEVSVLGFVRNFFHGDQKFDSLFARLAAGGGRTAAFSNGAFDQFGPVINPSVVKALTLHSAQVEDQEEAGVEQMLRLFREGQHDVVIAHMSYTDYAAHKFHVDGPNYRRDYRRADRVVARVAAAVGPGETLVVMGDHGHRENGSHSIGQDVPSFLLYRGPAFKAGHFLGTVPLTSHTWLLGQLFGLPLPVGYSGGIHPEALAGDAATRTTAGTAAVVAREPVTGVLWVYVAALAVIGAGLIWPERAPWMRPREARWLVWLTLLPALAPLPWNGWIGTVVALAVLGWLLRGTGLRVWIGAAAAIATGLAWHGWGRVLAGWHKEWQAVTGGQLVVAWLAAGALTLGWATRDNRRWFVIGAGAVGFLTFATNYHYGFTAMMVPLLWLWFAGVMVSLIREGRLRTPAERIKAAMYTAAVFGFTQLFVGVEGSGFAFGRFVPVFDRWTFETLVVTGLLAKVVIFYPGWPRRWLPAVVAALFIGASQFLHWRMWEPGAWDGLLVTGGLLGGWLGLRRRDPELAQVFLLGLLGYLYVYFVRPTRESYDRAACVLAALTLAARWVRRFPQPRNLRFDYVVLGVVAVLATGHFTMRWSIEGLEWSRIYSWVPAHLAETAPVALIILPWLVLKSSIPLFTARVLLAREFAGAAPWPGEELRRLVGFKVLTMLLVLTGLGLTGALQNVYLEAVWQLVVLGILSVGLFFTAGESPAG